MPASSLSALLTGLTSEQQATRKAEALSRLLSEGEFTVGNKTVSISRFTTWTTNGVTITVSGARLDSGTLWVACTASDANGPLPSPDHNEHGFINPPIRRYTRAPTSESDPGETTEDIAAVVQGFIYDSVVAYARNHGWDG